MRISVKIWLFMLSSFLLINCNLYSQQKKKVPISDLYNTGVDNGKNPLADGETDDHYILLQSADAGFPGPESKVVFSDVFPIGCWIANDNLSKWIAPRADAGNFNSAGLYVYTMQFSLKSFKPETADIRGLWCTDNNGIDILINGKSTGFVTAYNQFGFGFAPFEIKDGFVYGMNSISFVVYNGEAPTGLRVIISGEAEPIDAAGNLHNGVNENLN